MIMRVVQVGGGGVEKGGVFLPLSLCFPLLDNLTSPFLHNMAGPHFSKYGPS